LLLSGSLLLVGQRKRSFVKAGKALAVIVLVLALFRLYRRMQGLPDIFDYLFPAARGPLSYGVSVCFVLASLGIILLDWHDSLVSHCIGAALGFTTMVAGIGHLYNVPAFYSFFRPPSNI